MPTLARSSGSWRTPPTVRPGAAHRKQPHVAPLQRDAGRLLSLQLPSVRSYLSRWGRVTPALIRLQLAYPDDVGAVARLGAIRSALADVLPLAPTPESYRDLAKAYFGLVDWWTEWQVGGTMTKDFARRGLVAVRRLIAQLHALEAWISKHLEDA